MERSKWLPGVLSMIILVLSDNAAAFTLLAGDDGMPAGHIFSPALVSEATPGSPAVLLAVTDPAAPAADEAYRVELPFSLDLPRLLLSDTAHVLTAPARWDRRQWLTFSLLAGGVGAAVLADKPIRSRAIHSRNSVGYDIVDNFHQYGVYYSLGALGLFYAGGLIAHNPKAEAVAIDGVAASLIASVIITPGLKYAIGRARPSSGKGTHYFTPFSTGNNSFPSGETTQAFAVASVIASHYDEWWIKTAPYGAASLVGVARIYHDQHWTSDVLAGALVGSAVGISVVRYNEKRRSDRHKQSRLLVAPLLSANAAGVSINLIR